MADTFQNEVPTLRINLKLAIQTDGTQRTVQLPIEPLSISGFSNGKESWFFPRSDKRDVNQNNFDRVLCEFSCEINLIVQNTLT